MPRARPPCIPSGYRGTLEEMTGSRAVRSLSFTEIQAAITCPARWDFAYGGRLAGSALRRRAHATILSDGKAWGAAVAAWHAHQGHETLESAYDPTTGRYVAHAALRGAYAADVIEQQTAGAIVDVGHEFDRIDRLGEILDHYMTTAGKLENLTLLEGRFEVPLLSRGGIHRSTKYRLEGYLDGFTVDEDGGEWIVEFKLRQSLTPRKFLTLSRQHLWYAWARQALTKRPVIGVICDERLNDAPKAAKAVILSKRKTGTTYRPSGDLDEMTTAESYLALCDELGAIPKNHYEKIRGVAGAPLATAGADPVPPRRARGGGSELVSAGRLIADLERGDRYPIRNGQRLICQGCRYNDICPNPQDTFYVDTLFERTLPKREREKEAA